VFVFGSERGGVVLLLTYWLYVLLVIVIPYLLRRYVRLEGLAKILRRRSDSDSVANTSRLYFSVRDHGSVCYCSLSKLVGW
jgi:hypothetical protein